LVRGKKIRTNSFLYLTDLSPKGDRSGKKKGKNCGGEWAHRTDSDAYLGHGGIRFGNPENKMCYARGEEAVDARRDRLRCPWRRAAPQRDVGGKVSVKGEAWAGSVRGKIPRGRRRENEEGRERSP